MNLIPGFKQILTRDGWIDIEKYYDMLKRSPVQVLIYYNNKCHYVSPVSFASSYYKGTLIELNTDTSRIILKPSFKIANKKTSVLNKGERIPKVFSYQTVEKKSEVQWDGNHFLLFFGQDVQLPIKFENDYILVNV